MVKPTSSKAAAAPRRSEFSGAASRKVQAGTPVGKARARAEAPVEVDLAAGDPVDDIRITREGFRATPRDDRAG
jgi:hypothetical protein